MEADDIAYIRSHPLAYEILYSLCELEQASSTQIAKRLGRGLTTIFESLTKIHKETNLVKILDKEISSDKRNTFFILDNLNDVKAILERNEVIIDYAKKSSRLRTVPRILMEIFESKLAMHLNEFKLNTGVWIPDILPGGEIIPTFTITIFSVVQHIFIIRIRKNEAFEIHESIGKIINIKLASDKPYKIIMVYLFSPKTSKAYEESIHRFIDGLNSDKMDLKAIVDFVSDEDLVNQYFIQKLSESISSQIKENIRSRENDLSKNTRMV